MLKLFRSSGHHINQCIGIGDYLLGFFKVFVSHDLISLVLAKIKGW